MYGDNHIYGGKIFYKNSPSRIWYAGGNIKLHWGYIFHRGIRKIDSEKYSVPIKTEYITGCCLFTSVKVIKKLDGFDEKFNMYGEDVDFCLRAYEKNIYSYFYPKVILWHHVSASIGGEFSIKKLSKKIYSTFKLIIKHKYYYIR